MYSLNLDYLFNTVYNVLLWIRYTWVFSIWRRTPEEYLAQVDGREWDGLRDRGWVQELIDKRDHHIFSTDKGFIGDIAEKLGITLPDSDRDGIPDVHDNTPYDAENLTAAEMKERYQSYYDFWDHLRDFFGFGPADLDRDGLPDSFEKSFGTDPQNPDTDHDGVLDGRDAFPLDGSRSAEGLDTDRDGLSDVYEKSMGTDPNDIDTDHDGIPDGSDTFPLDPLNKTVSVHASDYTRHLDNLHLAIQNPILQFVRDIFSLLALIGLVFLALSFMRFFREFWKAQMHYEHHFGHGDHGHGDHGDHGHAASSGHGDKGSHAEDNDATHKESHGDSVHDDHETSVHPAIAGLAVMEGLPFEIEPPTTEAFEKHPKWAIIEGYMSSDSEALWRIGILEADMMLRDVLVQKGYVGADVGELLQATNFKTTQLAWEAHKVRNRIAHEGSDYLLTEREARRVFGLFESVFKELKAI